MIVMYEIDTETVLQFGGRAELRREEKSFLGSLRNQGVHRHLLIQARKETALGELVCFLSTIVSLVTMFS